MVVRVFFPRSPLLSLLPFPSLPLLACVLACLSCVLCLLAARVRVGCFGYVAARLCFGSVFVSVGWPVRWLSAWFRMYQVGQGRERAVLGRAGLMSAVSVCSRCPLFFLPPSMLRIRFLLRHASSLRPMLAPQPLERLGMIRAPHFPPAVRQPRPQQPARAALARASVLMALRSASRIGFAGSRGSAFGCDVLLAVVSQSSKEKCAHIRPTCDALRL